MARDERNDQVDSEINRLMNLKRQLRMNERSLRGREAYLSQPDQFAFNNVKQLRGDLSDSLQPFMMPANVGGIDEVAWPFYYQASVDFGDDPTISINTIQRGFFQVTQEACFILMSISRAVNVSAAGLSAVEKAPLQVEFVDRQSSRRFNDAPTPFQMIGNNSNPMILPTGMLVMPNAFIDVNVSGIPTVPQSFTGSGFIQFSFFGYRTRTENADKVLSTIFAK